MNHTHHTSKHLIIQTPMTGAINHGWAEDKLQQGRKQSAEHVSHLYHVAFITCVPHVPQSATVGKSMDDTCTKLHHTTPHTDSHGTDCSHVLHIEPSCTASTIVNTLVPYCTRQIPHYIIWYSVILYHIATLPLERHGNAAVESVVSPSQIICRGGHTHLGYLTAKSRKERRKRRMSSIYSKQLSKMHMLHTRIVLTVK